VVVVVVVVEVVVVVVVAVMMTTPTPHTSERCRKAREANSRVRVLRVLHRMVHSHHFRGGNASVFGPVEVAACSGGQCVGNETKVAGKGFGSKT
jgi:hypothetical protein